MKPETFLELMNELPGDMVVSAVSARYRRSPAVWIPAVAACLAATVAAAVYPGLRVQEPEIAETTVLTAGTGGTYPTTPVGETQEITTDIPPAATTAYTTTLTESRTTSTATAGTTTASRETETVSQSTAEPPLTTEQTRQPDTTEPPPETTASATREQPETTGKATTGTSATTTAPATTRTSATTTALATTRTSETTRKSDTTELQPETTSRLVTTSSATTGEAEITTRESTTPAPAYISAMVFTTPTPADAIVTPAEPHLDISYDVFPADADEAEREWFGIPAEFDLGGYFCLRVRVNTHYRDAAVIGGRISGNAMRLQFAFLDDGRLYDSRKEFVIAVQPEYSFDPNACSAGFITVADEAEFYAMQTNELSIHI